MATFGTFREDDGSQVELQAALRAWADNAHEVLVDTATHFGAIITYSQLGDEVQRWSRIRTTMLLSSWVGRVLSLVVHRCHNAGEPALSALVVRQEDGEVGDAYDEVLLVAGLRPIHSRVEREDHAAAARLECYRYFGADVPADAVPMLSPWLAQRRGLPLPTVSRPGSRPAAKRRTTAGSPRSTTPRKTAQPRATAAARVNWDDVPRPICPTCFLELPATGVCYNCA